jgi:proteic killer suppression protein
MVKQIQGQMDIMFKNQSLANLINSEKALRKKFGEICGRKVMHRMAVLSAAPCLADVPIQTPERCHMLTGDRKGEFAVEVYKQYRITFIPNHDPIPAKEDGGIDLTKVTAIVILNVEDYH